MRVKVLGMGLLAGLFALLVAGPVANAAILMTAPETESFSLTAPQATYTVTRNTPPPSTVNLTNASQSDDASLVFNQFDGGLGTLLAVTVTFSSVYGATATVTVGVNGETDTLVDFFSDAKVSHSLTNASLIADQSAPLQSFSATCSAAFEFGCGKATTSDNGVNFDTPPPPGVVVTGSLLSFTGGGTYTLTATLSSLLAPRIDPDNGTVVGDNSTFNGTLDATWNGSVSVVYTYSTNETSVPLPLSLYLLLAGLGGVALSRRYRR